MKDGNGCVFKFLGSAKKWKAVMQRAKRAELRSSPKANQNAGRWKYRIAKPKTFPNRGFPYFKDEVRINLFNPQIIVPPYV